MMTAVATVAEAHGAFEVQHTGRSEDHFTVLLPNPVDAPTADAFNRIFRMRPHTRGAQ
jgi:hypothetical protein